MNRWEEEEQYRREQHFLREAQRRGLSQGAMRRELHQRPGNARSLTGGQDEEESSDYEDLYFYLFAIGSLATTAQAIVNVTIQSDSKFEWMRTTVQGNKNGETEPWSTNDQVPITVLIVDNGSGRQLMNAAVPVNLIAGSGRLPFINPVARIFQPSASVQVTAVNYGPTTWDNINVCFIGRKIFKGR